VAADDFEMPVSRARRLNDFCDVCSNTDPMSSSVTSVSTRHFLQVSCPEVTQ
jgi:hypothetical protein